MQPKEKRSLATPNLNMGQLQEKYKSYRDPQKFMKMGVYPYFREITSKQGTEVTDIDGHHILMFGSNACLLYTSPSPRDRSLSRMPSSA